MKRKPLRGLYFDSWEIGKEYIGMARTITETDVVTFNYLSRDVEDGPLYDIVDGKKLVGVHGTLTASIAQGLITTTGIFEGTEIAMLGSSMRWMHPVLADDTIVPVLVPTEKRLCSSRPGAGILKCEIVVYNQNDQAVMEMEWTLMVATSAEGAEANSLVNEAKER